MPGPSYRSLHLEDLEGGIRRERSTLPGLSKTRLAVQSKGGRAVRWGPQTESAQSALPCPVEDLLEQGTSDSAPSPCGVYPHTADPAHLALVPVKEAIGRAQHVVAFIGEEHHMTSGFSNRTGEVLPVRGGPRHNVCERLAKGIWRLLQGSQAKLAVEAYLVWLQSSKVHEITHKAVERCASAAAGSRSAAEVGGSRLQAVVRHRVRDRHRHVLPRVARSGEQATADPSDPHGAPPWMPH